MRLLLDINVLLDVVLEREPWSGPAAELLAAVEARRVEGFVAPHTLPTLYYVVAKIGDRRTATQAMHDLLQLVDIVPIRKQELRQALTFSIADFEDAIQAASALAVEADYLVTRNEADFKAAPIVTATPSTVLTLL